MRTTKTKFDRTDPTTWDLSNATIRRGAEAAAHGRSVLEAAGVDTEALERRVGRPRVGGGPGRTGARNPRVNTTITVAQDEALRAREGRDRSRSDIVRAALDEYLASHP